MPRTKQIAKGRMKSERILAPVTAAATSFATPAQGPKRKKVKPAPWHKQAWLLYDEIEVYHYACQWVGNTLSRAKLVVHENGKVTTNQVALDGISAFFGGHDQQSEFLRQSGIHMTVAGEGWIVGEASNGDEDQWSVVSATQVKSDQSGNWTVEGEEINPAETVLIRFWRPHPEDSRKPDSPTRPLLKVLNQLDSATDYVTAQLDSRLTSAGILKVPSEMDLATPEGGDRPADGGASRFIDELMEVAELAKADRTSPSARVPIILRGPGEHLPAVDFIKPWTELDENAPKLREELIRRIALGLDMPPDALTGTGDTNHWSAWQIEDSLIKSHAEPLLKLLVSAVTVEYLRPYLLDNGISEEDIKNFEIVADTADMRLRPDRSQQALEMWDRGELSGAALRREVGFDETDAMDDEETKQWLLRKLAQGSPAPETVHAAAEALGVKLDLAEITEALGGGDDEKPRGERPLPRSLEKHPKRDIPEQKASALLATSEMAVFRALERAGNRMKNKLAKAGAPNDIRAAEVYQFVALSRDDLDYALEDAWSILQYATLPEGITADHLESRLDVYARTLITSQKPYDAAVLEKYLELLADAA